MTAALLVEQARQDVADHPKRLSDRRLIRLNGDFRALGREALLLFSPLKAKERCNQKKLALPLTFISPAILRCSMGSQR